MADERPQARRLVSDGAGRRDLQLLDDFVDYLHLRGDKLPGDVNLSAEEFVALRETGPALERHQFKEGDLVVNARRDGAPLPVHEVGPDWITLQIGREVSPRLSPWHYMPAPKAEEE